jgi:hypothetical protein
MVYAKNTLCVLTAILVGLYGPGFWTAFHGFSQEKATGLVAVAGGLLESLLSPLSWILAIVVFGLLFGASHLGNKALRVSLFWIPSLAISILGFGLLSVFLSLFAYAWFHRPQL